MDWLMLTRSETELYKHFFAFHPHILFDGFHIAQLVNKNLAENQQFDQYNNKGVLKRSSMRALLALCNPDSST